MFSPRRFLAILVSRSKEFYRDLGALAWTFLFPILMIFAFSYMFKMDSGNVMKAGLVGSEPVSVREFQWVTGDRLDDLLGKLAHHKFDIVVQNDGGVFNYWVSETSPRSRIAEKVFLASLSVEGANGKTIRNTITGREITYIDWLFPGLLTMNVMWLALWGVGWVIVRQRKFGILKRYKASPLTALEYLLAQMISRLAILEITGISIFSFAHLIHPFKTEGSLIDLFIAYTLGCLALSSIGLLVAARITSDEFASGVINLVSFPMMFLSEVWFSLEGAPDWVFYIAKAMPLWHMTDAMRRIMNEGATLVGVQAPLLTLGIISVVCTLVGSLSFRWTAD